MDEEMKQCGGGGAGGSEYVTNTFTKDTHIATPLFVF